MTVGEGDLCKLAAIVTAKREDLPTQGLPLSLLNDLMDQIRCDTVLFEGFDSRRQDMWFGQCIPEDIGVDDQIIEASNQAHWQHYWGSEPCSHPDRRSAHRGEDRGHLLRPAVALQRHVRRRVPAAGH